MTICTIDMKPLHKHPIFSIPGDAFFDLKDPNDRDRYFRLALTTTAFFSFMSSLIVHRGKLVAVPLEELFIGSCWAHVARIFRMIPTGLVVKYISDSLLLKRGENDSFLEHGLVHRIGIAINGFDRIFAELFGAGSVEAYHMRRVIRNEYTLAPMLYAKMRALEVHSRENSVVLDQLAGKLYSDPEPGVRIRHLAYRASPYALLKVVHVVCRYFRR